MLRAFFWTSAGLIAYAHAGYPLLLWLIARRRGSPSAQDARGVTTVSHVTAPVGEGPFEAAQDLPHVSLIVAAYDEEAVIARRVENLLALDYPRERLELIVASDGSADRTAALAREAGADLVLELPRAGKVRTQDTGVECSRGAILAFGDANSTWAPDALRRLVAPFSDPRVGYVCGQVRFLNEGGDNQEGAYWRYEMAVRALESKLAGVTAGNGSIYAVRRDAYLVVDPRMGHDLSFPFNLVKRGWRALYAADALAEEKMVPSIEGEFQRKRRMMSHTWAIVVEGGMLDPRGLPPLYALEIASHRLLRYLTPFLHLSLLATTVALAPRGRPYAAALGAHVAFAGLALAGRVTTLRPARLALYYSLVTASLAAGMLDWMRTGTPAEWEKAEGTR